MRVIQVIEPCIHGDKKRLYLTCLKPVFHWATFFARSDFRLLKLNRFLISSSGECSQDKRKSCFARHLSPSGKRALGLN